MRTRVAPGYRGAWDYCCVAVITSSRTVRATPAATARVLLDWGHDPAWRRRVRRMTVEPPGPAVVGQRVVERLRFAGLTFTTPTEITHVGEGRAGYEGAGALFRLSGRREVAAVAINRTRVEEVLDLQLKGPLRPLTWIVAAGYRRLQEQDIDCLVRLLESADGGPSEANAWTGVKP